MTDSSRKKERVQRTVLIVVVVVIFTAGLIVSIYDGIQKEKEFQYNRENYALALAALLLTTIELWVVTITTMRVPNMRRSA